MIAIALEVELYLPGRTSLKQKRKSVRAILDGIAPKFGAAAAEVDAQDLHQRAVLGFALVGGTPSEVRQRADALVERLRRRPEWEVGAVGRQELARESSLAEAWVNAGGDQ